MSPDRSKDSKSQWLTAKFPSISSALRRFREKSEDKPPNQTSNGDEDPSEGPEDEAAFWLLHKLEHELTSDGPEYTVTLLWSDDLHSLRDFEITQLCMNIQQDLSSLVDGPEILLAEPDATEVNCLSDATKDVVERYLHTVLEGHKYDVRTVERWSEQQAEEVGRGVRSSLRVVSPGWRGPRANLTADFASESVA